MQMVPILIFLSILGKSTDLYSSLRLGRDWCGRELEQAEAGRRRGDPQISSFHLAALSRENPDIRQGHIGHNRK